MGGRRHGAAGKALARTILDAGCCTSSATRTYQRCKLRVDVRGDELPVYQGGASLFLIWLRGCCVSASVKEDSRLRFPDSDPLRGSPIIVNHKQSTGVQGSPAEAGTRATSQFPPSPFEDSNVTWRQKGNCLVFA